MSAICPASQTCQAAGWLTAEKVCADAARSDYAWGGVGGSWDNSTQRDTPADLAEDRGVADHLPTIPEGGYCR